MTVEGEELSRKQRLPHDAVSVWAPVAPVCSVLVQHSDVVSVH